MRRQLAASIIALLVGLLVVACAKPTPTATPIPTPTPIPTATPTPTPVVYANTVVIASGKYVDVPLTLEALNRVVGDITIEGGGNDVNFVIWDPFKNEMQDLGRVSRNRSFAFVATVSGNYYLRFDNSFSLVTNKVVRYSVTVHYR